MGILNQIVNKLFTPPTPPAPPKPAAPPPPPPKPKTEATSDANAKRGEVTANSAQKRQEVEDKLNINVVGSTVAGARKTLTSGAERAGFPPRSPQSAQAARVVADIINAGLKDGVIDPKYNRRNAVIGAAIHKDGSITITASGSGEDTKVLYEEKIYKREQNPQTEKTAQQPKQKTGKPTEEEIQQRREAKQNRTPEQVKADDEARKSETEAKKAKTAEKAEAAKKRQETIDNAPTLKSKIQEKLDEVFKNDPTVKRTAQGNVDWDFGKTDTSMNPTSNLERRNGNFEPMSHTADNCAAGKMYHSEKSQGGKNPVVAADEVWRPSTGNAHTDKTVVNNTDNRSMCPCSSCAGNADKVMNGNAEIPKMTVRSAAKTGLIGAATAGVASSLQQLWNDGTVDVKKVAEDTVTGGGLAIAGEAIENSVASKAAQYFSDKYAGRVVTEAMENVPAKALTAAEANVKSLANAKLVGAGVAGAAIGMGMEIHNQWNNFGDSAKRPEAVGAVVAQGAVGFAAGVAGAQIGAAVGTFIPIPVVGTLAGAAVGFAVGAGVSWLASATGADKAIASGVAAVWKAGESAVSSIGQGISDAASSVKDAVSGSFNKLSSIFG